MKILIVEDDVDLQEIISVSLLKERYVVETAAEYRTARSKAMIYEYDCILLDIMLPDGSGLDLLRYLSASGRKPNVIILSAKDSIEDKVAGLDLGADDYLPKPFHLAELHARMKSVMRRKDHGGQHWLTFGNVSVDPTGFQAKVDGRILDLGRKEFDILLYFMVRPNKLVEKQMLAEAVWGDHIDQVDSFDFIYAQMKNLRRRLKEADAGIEIKTVYGIGYKLTNIV
jgi:DNA-binding response OmpR family regulator